MNKRKLLVYCAYPIIDHNYEPGWIEMINYVKSNNMLENIEIYRPFFSLETQEKLHPILSTKNDNTELNSLVELLQLDKALIPDNVEEAIKLEANNEYSKYLITKELWVLSKSDIIIADLDAPNRGDRDIPLVIARLLNLPIIGISNKFVDGPWLSALTNYKTDKLNLADMLQAIAYRFWEAEAAAEEAEDKNDL